MTPTTLRDRLRREVRDAVFCACRQRLVGAPTTADEWLATELSLLRTQHSGANVTDLELAMWQREDEENFAHAKLVSELVAEQVGRLLASSPAAVPGSSGVPGGRPPVATGTALRDLPPTERSAFGAVPDVADLLDGMLAQERRARVSPA